MRLCGGGVVEGVCVRGRLGVRQEVWAAVCGFVRFGYISVGCRIGRSKRFFFFRVFRYISGLSELVAVRFFP